MQFLASMLTSPLEYYYVSFKRCGNLDDYDKSVICLHQNKAIHELIMNKNGVVHQSRAMLAKTP